MTDFAELNKFTDKQIRIELKDSAQIITGECFCVDPLTKSVALLCKEENTGREHDYAPHIVLHHAIAHIEETSEETFLGQTDFLEYKRNFLDTLFGERDKTSGDVLKQRREQLCAWLEENRFTVEVVTTADGAEELSLINGTVVIEPPYTVDSCRSTNTIVLGRIMKMVKACPNT